MLPIARYLRFLLLICLSSNAAAAPETCPPGEKQICLDSCICLPDLSQILSPTPGSVPTEITQIAAPALALWIKQSHDQAALADTQPIPEALRAQLLRWYAPSVLDAARYKIGDNGELSAANTLLQNPDIGAVTLIDIIVFRTQEDAEHNTALWAHELKHVQQYQEWGADGFAQRYTQDFNQVEAPAYAVQTEVGRVLRGLE